MFGNDLYIVTIETVFDFVKTSRVLLVPATSEGQANLRVTVYLVDLNFPVPLAYNDGRNWYISQPLEKIELLTLMISPGAVRLGKDVDTPFDGCVPATLKESLYFKNEDDINPDVTLEFDPCLDCDEPTCFTCLFVYDEVMDDWDDWGDPLC